MSHQGFASLASRPLCRVAQPFGRRNPDENGLGINEPVQGSLRFFLPGQFDMEPGGRSFDLVKLGRERNDVEKRIEQRTISAGGKG